MRDRAEHSVSRGLNDSRAGYHVLFDREIRGPSLLFDAGSYGRILDNLYDGVYCVDRDRVIRYWNKAAERISGYTAAEVIGRPCSDNILTHVDGDGNVLCTGQCPLAMTIADGDPRKADVFLHHKHGHRVPVSLRVSPLTDAHGRITGAVELFSDISSYKFNELRIRELEKLALLDNLTRLANRNFLQREILSHIEEQKRHGAPFGILFVDIDHFKSFNDTYGHDVGDRVLRIVAETLVKNSRPFDVFGRWGGEEFIGIVRNATLHDLEQTGDRLRILVEKSYIPMGNANLHVTISIGATLNQDSDSMDTLIKRADTLLYESKRAGRNRLTMG